MHRMNEYQNEHEQLVEEQSNGRRINGMNENKTGTFQRTRMNGIKIRMQEGNGTVNEQHTMGENWITMK